MSFLSFFFLLSFWKLVVSRHRSSSLAGISDKSMSQKKRKEKSEGAHLETTGWQTKDERKWDRRG
jgi:hypothetical protein